MTTPDTAAIDRGRATQGSDTRLDLALATRQVRHELRIYTRNRRRVFFTFALPVMFVVIFGALYGNDPVKELGNRGYLTFFVPGILAYGIIMSTFTSVAAAITQLRDTGVLKRVKGTPIPRWAYLAGHVGTVATSAVAVTTIVLAVGALYGVPVPWHAMPGVLSAVLVGGAAFTALGFAAVSLIKNADSGAMVVNLLILPLSFISGIWGPPPTGFLLHVAEVFPLRMLADALQHAYDPAVHGAALRPHDLLLLAAWGAAGLRLSQRFLKTEAANA